MKKLIFIEGMSCNHCVTAVKNALSEIEGISHVDVELNNNRAIVEGESISDEIIKEKIEEAGYNVIEIK
ncbi:copper ion binding protein [Keratinibaculum paraultunense]|uniref:Copper ion binding protein n=1 Tax=Keratinibaculum paraultunense TaxID=1278232 RepID=A0A4R3KUJ0_9FIRM|nr:cation transporter [Keratinibaculum paraultunense]QQY79830.1 heavy-metal-associated domain-containing protein [Keratinibaculum paraultunense]TCS88711.1 copper ion binding protein [Keratinibaculum paraultunense]